MAKAKVKAGKAEEKVEAPAADAAPAKAGKKKAAPAPAGTDLLSQTVLLCQAQRWREAAGICRRVLERAHNDGNEELAASLSGALSKIEYSLRRQMAAAAVAGTRRLLAEEFLLDVAS